MTTQVPRRSSVSGRDGDEILVGFESEFARRVVQDACHPDQVASVAETALRELEKRTAPAVYDATTVELLAELAVRTNSDADKRRLLRAAWGVHRDFGGIDLRGEYTSLYESASHRIALLAAQAGFTTEEALQHLFDASEVAAAAAAFTLAPVASRRLRTLEDVVEEQQPLPVLDASGQPNMWVPPGREVVLRAAPHELPAVPSIIPNRNMLEWAGGTMLDFSAWPVNNIYPPLALGPMATLVRRLSMLQSDALFTAKQPAGSDPIYISAPFDTEYLAAVVERYRSTVAAGLGDDAMAAVMRDHREGEATLTGNMQPGVVNNIKAMAAAGGPPMEPTLEEELALIRATFQRKQGGGRSRLRNGARQRRQVCQVLLGRGEASLHRDAALRRHRRLRVAGRRAGGIPAR